MELSAKALNDIPRSKLEIVSPTFSKSINFNFPEKQLQPIQLVGYDETKGTEFFNNSPDHWFYTWNIGFYVTEEAEKFFEDYENKKLGIITIIGKSRTGKSYLLNRVLLNRENGFHVGHTINPCTRVITW